MNETTPATTDVTTDAIISDFWRSSSPHRRSKSNCGIQAPMSPISANDRDNRVLDRESGSSGQNAQRGWAPRPRPWSWTQRLVLGIDDIMGRLSTLDGNIQIARRDGGLYNDHSEAQPISVRR